MSSSVGLIKLIKLPATDPETKLTQITNMRNEKGGITADPSDIKKKKGSKRTL